MKDVLENIKEIMKSPFHVICLLAGILFSFLAFCKIKTDTIEFMPNKTIFIIVGVLLIVISIAHYFFRYDRDISSKLLTKIYCESLEIELIKGRIENENDLTKFTAFIMPIDTAFSNECISHTNSVAYSILAKFHIDKIATLDSDIIECLRGIEKINGKYFLGTSIILPEKYNTPAKCIFSASAAFGEIYATAPEYINACISNIFKIATQNRLDKLLMPVLGSGRAGMELNEALRTLVSSLKFYSKYNPTIKLVRIYTIDSKKIKDIDLLKKIVKI
jgi:hypothetical protein